MTESAITGNLEIKSGKRPGNGKKRKIEYTPAQSKTVFFGSIF